jgi:hypothetical protein
MSKQKQKPSAPLETKHYFPGVRIPVTFMEHIGDITIK